jgi:hypothetical protein
MKSIDEFQTKPHPALKLIKKHRIPLKQAALFVGLSYHHLSHVLNGHYPSSKRVERRLRELMGQLKTKEGD